MKEQSSRTKHVVSGWYVSTGGKQCVEHFTRQTDLLQLLTLLLM